MTTRGSKSRIRRFFEAAFLIVGVGGLSIWGWSLFQQGWYEDWNNWAFERRAHNQRVALTDYVREKMASHRSDPKPQVQPLTIPDQQLRTQGGYPKANGEMGRLLIPRLNLSAMVREGTSEKTLSLALGHIAGTSLPGQNGNVGVAGHRDALFRGLSNIKANDRIVFETSRGDVYAYQVTGTQVVKPTEVSVLNAGLYPELTLVTCYPFSYIGSAPDRFIVKARQISQTTRQQPATEIASKETVSPKIISQETVSQATEGKEIAGKEPAEPKPVVRIFPKPGAAAPQRLPVAQDRKSGIRRVPFEIAKNKSRNLAPGISIGLTSADAVHGKIDGWMWLMPDRRTIWLRDQSTRKPYVFFGADGTKRELVISSVSGNSVRGYLLVTDPSPSKARAL